MTLSEILDTVRPVEGWFSDQQMQILYPYVTQLPPNALLVEIGTFHGRSTLFFRLANPEIKILTIDPCQMYVVNEKLFVPTPHIDDKVLNYGNIFQIVDTSYNVRQYFNWKIDLLHVDGNHTYEAVMDDAHWIQFLKPNGYVFFHDYKSDHRGVEKAVDELIGMRVIEMVHSEGTVCIAKKP